MTQLGGQPEIQAVSDFLHRCPPFNILKEQDFQSVVSSLEITYFRHGHTFNNLTEEKGLRILRSGAIEIRDSSGKLLDRLGEGENFNIAGLCESQPDAQAVLIEDALIYLLKEPDFQQIREQSRKFDRFFHSQRDRRLRRAVRYEETPHQLMTPLSSLMSKDVLMLPSDSSVQKSAAEMTRRRVSSALIMQNDTLVGIITDRDFRTRVMAKGLPPTTPVTSVMTPEPCVIDGHATVFDATLLMTRAGYHHLPVVDHGAVIGIITASDLMLAKQNDPVYLVQHISRQSSVSGLKSITETLPNLLIEWVGAQTRARHISHIFTAISDAVTTRLIELAIETLGPAPVPFCWLGFGSQARGEQLLGGDQDNGLLISDQLKEEDKPWFESLAKFVCDGLNSCGYVYCPGKVMATTQEWRQPLLKWRQMIDSWTRSPTLDAVMRVSIFFDLRSIYGDSSLCQQLQRYMLEQASKNTIFLAALAENVLALTPPIGIFRRFLVERNGEHKDTLDLKKRGVIPIIDMVRIHALSNKIPQVNTHDRIAELMGNKKLAIANGRNLQDAFDYLMQLRVNEQVKQLSRGEEVSNYYNPNNLPELGRKHLRDAFTVIHDAQEALRLSYRRAI